MNPAMQPEVLTPILSRRILVVDDNADITMGMRMLLELLGQEVRTANDGPTAILIAAEFHPDVVLLDLGLPRMDGYDVARELRKMPDGATTEIIAVSGWGDAESRTRSAAAGFTAHWLKPVGRKELRAYLMRR